MKRSQQIVRFNTTSRPFLACVLNHFVIRFICDSHFIFNLSHFFRVDFPKENYQYVSACICCADIQYSNTIVWCCLIHSLLKRFTRNLFSSLCLFYHVDLSFIYLTQDGSINTIKSSIRAQSSLQTKNLHKYMKCLFRYHGLGWTWKNFAVTSRRVLAFF